MTFYVVENSCLHHYVRNHTQDFVHDHDQNILTPQQCESIYEKTAKFHHSICIGNAICKNHTIAHSHTSLNRPAFGGNKQDKCFSVVRALGIEWDFCVTKLKMFDTHASKIFQPTPILALKMSNVTFRQFAYWIYHSMDFGPIICIRN